MSGLCRTLISVIFCRNLATSGLRPPAAPIATGLVFAPSFTFFSCRFSKKAVAMFDSDAVQLFFNQMLVWLLALCPALASGS